MHSFFRPLFEIAFFKRSPASLPATTNYMVVLLVLTFFVAIVSVYISEIPNPNLIFKLIFLVSLSAAILYTILNYVNKKERFAQAFSAKLGANIVINILLLPAVYTITHSPENSLAFLLSSVGYLLSIGWSVAVYAYILREASELGKVECGLLAVSISLLMLLLSAKL